MSRRFNAPKRQIIPDAKYGDQLVAKFVNSLMLGGKRSTAEKCLYGAFNIIEERFKEEPLDVFKKALDAVKPRVEVKSRRVGGATFQVPTEVRPDRRISLGIKWMIKYSRLRNEKTMRERLAGEIIAASKGEGASVKKKDDTHRMAEANKAFSHFRF